MAEQAIMDVVGLQEVQQMLQQAPKLIVAAAFISAATDASAVIESAIASRTPIGGEKIWNEETFSEIALTGGNLLTSLDHEVTLDSKFRGVYAEIGFRGFGSTVAKWQEFGWRLTSHRPGLKFIKEIKPKPFVRPAFDASGDEAISVFADKVASILKAGIRGLPPSK